MLFLLRGRELSRTKWPFAVNSLARVPGGGALCTRPVIFAEDEGEGGLLVYRPFLLVPRGSAIEYGALGYKRRHSPSVFSPSLPPTRRPPPCFLSFSNAHARNMHAYAYAHPGSHLHGKIFNFVETTKDGAKINDLTIHDIVVCVRAAWDIYLEDERVRSRNAYF